MCGKVFIRVRIHGVESSAEERPIVWIDQPPPGEAIIQADYLPQKGRQVI